MEYDTVAIRAAARSLDRIAGSVESTRNSKVAGVHRALNGLRGDTIDAIDDVTGELSSELNSIRKGLESCANALYEFARKLDEADYKARHMIGSK